MTTQKESKPLRHPSFLKPLLGIGVFLLFVWAGCAPQSSSGSSSGSNDGSETDSTQLNNSDTSQIEKVDDWVGMKSRGEEKANSIGSGARALKKFSRSTNKSFKRRSQMGVRSGGGMQRSPAAPEQRSMKKLGYSTGGAKDINNFRDNIRNGYLPLPTDVTVEGLYYDYYFDTGRVVNKDRLFYPTYKTALAKDALSGETDRYITVGLNSGMDLSEFSRKKLNLVVVMDISGSMGIKFNRYYYDRFGNKKKIKKSEARKKIRVAADSVAALTRHLKKGDRFGMVLFNSHAHRVKPMRNVEATKMDDIREHIRKIHESGGTNMAAGMKKATDMLKKYRGADPSEYENRIIFMTDAMPNMGNHSEDGLLGLMNSNSKDGVYTTFIGMGVDFNTELVEAISKVRGCNYYSVHSAEQFKKRMDNGFKYMVTPLVFNLKLKLESKGYRIKKVYGSPEAEAATGELMQVKTLFPSPVEGGRTKGGVVLVELEKTGKEKEAKQNGKHRQIRLTASWENRQGKADSESTEIKFPDQKAPHYENSGIRKAVLLAEYANLLQAWLLHERSKEEKVKEGLRIPDGVEPLKEEWRSSRWERQSRKLKVSNEYQKRLKRFREHFQKETEGLGDENLKRELKVLKTLIELK